MGTYLTKPVKRKLREDAAGPGGLRIASCEMQGWRINQEDAHLALPAFDAGRGLGLFGVFDGHCGGVVAAMARELLPRKLRAAPAFRSGNYPLALHEAFLALDRHLDSPLGRKMVQEGAVKVRQDFAGNLQPTQELEAEGLSLMEVLDDICSDNPDGMGCTAVVALLEYNLLTGVPFRLHVANCGDSRCVLVNDMGKAIAMSKDHKPRNRDERSRIEAAGGWVTSEGRIEGNLNLSRALGDFYYKRTRKQGTPETQMISGVPEVRSRDLHSRDRFLLLGCDGVWETRRGSQATIDALRRFLPADPKTKLSVALSKLLDDGLAKDESEGLGMDNMTALLLRLPLQGAGTASKKPRVACPLKSLKSGVKRQLVRKRQLVVRRRLRKRPAAAAALPTDAPPAQRPRC